MNDTSSVLVALCGARKVTRKELMEIPVPTGTRTHQPLSHYEIVEVLEEALSFRYLKVVRDEYAVSQDGMKMFGVMDLDYGFSGCRFSIGLRNSNDKSMRLALTAGYRVFVCDNMAFSGDFTPMLYKHTRKLDLKDSVSIAIDRIHRGFEPIKAQVEAMRLQSLTDEEVKLIIYQAFLEGRIRGVPKYLLSEVHNLYFKPHYESFVPRNLWSLSNAFTSAFKKLAPVKQFQVTARLGAYLSEIQEKLKLRQEPKLDLLPGSGARAPLQLVETKHQQSSNEDEPEEDDLGEEFDEYYDSEDEEELIEEYERRVAA